MVLIVGRVRRDGRRDPPREHGEHDYEDREGDPWTVDHVEAYGDTDPHGDHRPHHAHREAGVLSG